MKATHQLIRMTEEDAHYPRCAELHGKKGFFKPDGKLRKNGSQPGWFTFSRSHQLLGSDQTAYFHSVIVKQL